MTLFTSTLIVAFVAVISFGGMWFAWKKRARAAAAIELPFISGDNILTLERVFYVATTPQGAPLERVSIPSLTYRGYAALQVHSQGITIQVTGEKPVTIPRAHIVDTTTARTRIDKAVEKDGLAVLTWSHSDRLFETSLRFATPHQQQQFRQAVAENFQKIIKEDA